MTAAELPTVGFLCMVRGTGAELPAYRARLAELDQLGRDHGLFSVHVTVVDNGCDALHDVLGYSALWTNPAATGVGFSAAVADPAEPIDGWIDTFVVARDDCPHFPSTEISPERWRHMNWLANVGLAAMPDVDLVAVVHPDLEWEPEQMLRAIDWTLNLDELVVAACPVFTRSGAYYDTWGTRVDGVRVGPLFDPDDPGRYGDVTSAAGALLAPGIARHVPWSGDAEVGWCERLGRYGIATWLLSADTCRVVHP